MPTPTLTMEHALEIVMKHTPLLTRFGIDVYDGQSLNTRTKQAQRRQGRQELREDIQTFTCVYDVFDQIGHAKTMMRYSSYGLKHYIENFLGTYVANGTCIAAAIAQGFRWKRCSATSPNVYFNMAREDLVGLQHAQSYEKLPLPSRRISATRRFAILQRDNYRCRLCGTAAHDHENVRLEVDHITAHVHGGTDDPSNLWVLCFDCNRGKGTHNL
jgi:hypothetical protein